MSGAVMAFEDGKFRLWLANNGKAYCNEEHCEKCNDLLVAMMTEITDLKLQIRKLEGKNETLQIGVDNLNSEIELLQKEINDLSINNDGLETENAALQSELDDLTMHNNEIVSHSKSLAATNDALIVQNERHQSEIGYLQTRIDDLNERLQSEHG